MTKGLPMFIKARRVAILLQLAFVGVLLMGRVVSSVVDASVAPALSSAAVSGLPGLAQ